MCGIAGISTEHREVIEKMTHALAHRGPDALQTYVGNGISLGHARLAILDPTDRGTQPMWNENRTIAIVYNGEVYNFRRLAKKHNIECATGTDTEVILKLYERKGIDCVCDFLGMFSFVLYDFQKKIFFLVRDPSGIKPLFYTENNGIISFSSELRSLLQSQPQKPKLNLQSLSHYLTLQYVPGPETMCEGIYQLPAGCILTFTEGRKSVKSFETKTDIEPITSASQFHETFPTLMDEVVRDHLISDRPIGIFLSGGMDSTIALYHMQNHAAHPVKTFTIRFDVRKDEEPERFNIDANLAQRTAEVFQTDHTEILFDDERCCDVYRATARALDQPNADSAAMATYVLAQEAVNTATVVLNGAGGDELFGGYPRYRIARILDAVRNVPVPILNVLGMVLPGGKDVLALKPGAELALRLLGRPQEENEAITREGWFSFEATRKLFCERFALIDVQDPVRQFMEFDRALWLIDESLRLTDGTTMASGLECRVPFLDQRIIQAVHPLAGSTHVGWRTMKKLLKETYAQKLPPHLRRLNKACFYPPLAKWIRRSCAPLVLESFEHPRIQEFFDVEQLRGMYKKHKERQEYHLHSLSAVMQLRFWFETVYDA